MTHNEWLAGLAVGDKAIMEWGYRETVERVARLTKTQIVVVESSSSGMARERKFNRTSGYEIGGGDRWLLPFTEERERKIQEAEFRSRALYAINDIDWPRLTNEELRSILAALGREVK